MTEFVYEAANTDGEQRQGTVCAKSPADAAVALGKSGLRLNALHLASGEPCTLPSPAAVAFRRWAPPAIAALLLLGLALLFVLTPWGRPLRQQVAKRLGTPFREHVLARFPNPFVPDPLPEPYDDPVTVAQVERLLAIVRERFPDRTVIPYTAAADHVGEPVILVGPVMNSYLLEDTTHLRFGLAPEAFSADIAKQTQGEFPEPPYSCFKHYIVQVEGVIRPEPERLALTVAAADKCIALEKMQTETYPEE
jgi:hypothetical protein